MNRIVLLIICLLLCSGKAVHAQVKFDSLPKGAVVLETRDLSGLNQRSRTLVLWMLNPKKNPLNYDRNEIYTCPDQTRGSYYSGPTRVSLINTLTNELINTIKVSSYDTESEDTLDLPYDIRRGYYYRVDAVSRNTAQGKPTIIALRDYNGDGKVLEFALFDAPACMGLQTTLIGYSDKQDKVVQYPIEMVINEQGQRATSTWLWADYLLTNKPQKPGYWKYEVDYRGRGGSLDKWEVRYNQTKEQFEGTVSRIADQP